MNRKGFTIIELIVVMAIIGILVLLASPRFSGQTKEAKLTNIISDTKVVEGQMDIYRIKFNDELPKDATPYDIDDLKAKIDENKVYSIKGLHLDKDSLGGEFYKIPENLVKRDAKSKLKGEFIISKNTGGVFYIDTKSGKPIDSGEDNPVEGEELKGYTNTLINFGFDNTNQRFIAIYEKDLELDKMIFSGGSNAKVKMNDVKNGYINPSNPKELFIDYSDEFILNEFEFSEGSLNFSWRNNEDAKIIEEVSLYFYAKGNQIQNAWIYKPEEFYSYNEAEQELTVSTRLPLEELFGEDYWFYVRLNGEEDKYITKILSSSYDGEKYTFIMDVSNVKTGNYLMSFLLQTDKVFEYLELDDVPISIQNSILKEETGNLFTDAWGFSTKDNEFFKIFVDNIGGIQEVAYITDSFNREIVDVTWEEWEGEFYGEFYVDPYIGSTITSLEIVSSNLTESINITRTAKIEWVNYNDYTTFTLELNSAIFSPSDITIVKYKLGNESIQITEVTWNGTQFAFTTNRELEEGERIGVYLYDSNDNEIGYRSLGR